MALAFECANAAEVDETYAKVVGEGFTGKTEPYDASGASATRPSTTRTAIPSICSRLCSQR